MIIPLDAEFRAGTLTSGSAAVFAVDTRTAEREHLLDQSREPLRPPPALPTRHGP